MIGGDAVSLSVNTTVSVAAADYSVPERLPGDRPRRCDRQTSHTPLSVLLRTSAVRVRSVVVTPSLPAGSANSLGGRLTAPPSRTEQDCYFAIVAPASLTLVALSIRLSTQMRSLSPAVASTDTSTRPVSCL